eukprot:g4478.t1
MRPKSAPSQGNKTKNKTKKWIGRQQNRSTSRYGKAYTSFTDPVLAQQKFDNLQQSGKFVTYKNMIKSVQSYSAAVEKKLHQQAVIPPIVASTTPTLATSASMIRVKGIKKASKSKVGQKSNGPKRIQVRKNKTSERNLNISVESRLSSIFRHQAFCDHNKRVSHKLKSFSELGTTQAIHREERNQAEISRLQSIIKSIENDALNDSMTMAEDFRNRMERTKRDAKEKAEKELSQAMKYEREWMNDEIDKIKKDHEIIVEKMSLKLEKIKAESIDKVVKHNEEKNEMLQQITNLNASHTVEVDNYQHAILKQKLSLKDSRLALAQFMAKSSSETAIMSTLLSHKEKMLADLQAEYAQLKNETEKSKLQLIQKCKEKDYELQRQQQSFREEIEKIQVTNTREIDLLRNENQEELQAIVLASAAREAKMVQNAVNRAQTGLSKVLISNAEKVRSTIVQRHVTIKSKLNARLREAAQKLQKHKKESKCAESILVASSVINEIIEKTIHHIETMNLMKLHEIKILHIEDKLVRQVQATEDCKEEIRFHKNQTIMMEKEMNSRLQDKQLVHESEIQAIKKKHKYELASINERARNRRQILLDKMIDQRKSLQKKFEAQKKEILEGFKRAIEATHVGDTGNLSSDDLRKAHGGSILNIDQQISQLTAQLTKQHIREKAALQIQCMVRTFLANRTCKRIRQIHEDQIYQQVIKDYSAVKIQSTWRKFSTQALYKKMRWIYYRQVRNNAARILQRSWRRYVQILRDHYAQLSREKMKEEKAKNTLRGEEQTVKYTAKAVIDAVENDDCDLLRKCIAVDATVIHRRHKTNGRVPFHAASSTEMGEILKAAGGDINVRDIDGQTPLTLSIANNRHISYIRWLISNGANINTLTASTQFCGPNAGPLHVAASLGKFQETELLLNVGANPNLRDSSGWPPLFYAVARNLDNSVDVVKILLESGARVNTTDSEGVTPLLLSVIQQNYDCSWQLLHAKADPNISSEQHGSPIYQSVLQNALRTLKQLLQYGGTPQYADQSGSTAFHVASRLKRHECLACLLEARPDILLADAKGNTPLHDAIIHNDRLAVNMLSRFDNCFLHKNNDGFTALQLAKRLGNQEIINMLLMPGDEGTGGNDGYSDKSKLTANVNVSDQFQYHIEVKARDSMIAGKNQTNDVQHAAVEKFQSKYANDEFEDTAAVGFYDDPAIEYWEEHFDENTKDTYWFNSQTGESSWNIPDVVSDFYHRREGEDEKQTLQQFRQISKPHDTLVVTKSTKVETNIDDWSTYRV